MAVSRTLPECVAFGTPMLGDTPAQFGGARPVGLASSIRFPRVPLVDQAFEIASDRSPTAASRLSSFFDRSRALAY